MGQSDYNDASNYRNMCWRALSKFMQAPAAAAWSCRHSALHSNTWRQQLALCHERAHSEAALRPEGAIWTRQQRLRDSAHTGPAQLVGLVVRQHGVHRQVRAPAESFTNNMSNIRYLTTAGMPTET
jgi:hypothetical protein